jgi:hypothetical protein
MRGAEYGRLRRRNLGEERCDFFFILGFRRFIIIIIIETCLSEYLIVRKHFVQAHQVLTFVLFWVLCTPNCPSGIPDFHRTS